MDKTVMERARVLQRAGRRGAASRRRVSRRQEKKRQQQQQRQRRRKRQEKRTRRTGAPPAGRAKTLARTADIVQRMVMGAAAAAGNEDGQRSARAGRKATLASFDRFAAPAPANAALAECSMSRRRSSRIGDTAAHGEARKRARLQQQRLDATDRALGPTLPPSSSRKGEHGSDDDGGGCGGGAPVTQVHRRRVGAVLGERGRDEGAAVATKTFGTTRTRSAPTNIVACAAAPNIGASRRRQPNDNRRVYFLLRKKRKTNDLGPGGWKSTAEGGAQKEVLVAGSPNGNCEACLEIRQRQQQAARCSSRGQSLIVQAPLLARNQDPTRLPVRRLRSMPQLLGQTRGGSSKVARRAGLGWVAETGGGSGGRLLLDPASSSSRRTEPPPAPAAQANLCHSRSLVSGGQVLSQQLARRRLGEANMARVAYGSGRVLRPIQRQVVFSMRQQHQHQQQLQASNRYLCDGQDEMEQVRASSRPHLWRWSEIDKSHECFLNEDRLRLCFHPHCSESAAACRAAEPLRKNGNYYYWEILVHDKIYGTSVMFGLCTGRQRLHAHDYCNLIGLDECGWSLSHKGYAWHNGQAVQYTQPFPTNQPITIGLLYNTMRGDLTYFMNGKNLGVAFKGLNDIQDELYPVVASTAKCTLMTLRGSYCGYVSLLERSCFTLLKGVDVKDRLEFVRYIGKQKLPRHLLEYVAEAANVSVAELNGADQEGDGTMMKRHMMESGDTNATVAAPTTTTMTRATRTTTRRMTRGRRAASTTAATSRPECRLNVIS